jgi:hypothetical protein
LTDDQIRREVERKLQNAGIPILSDREKAGGAPSLYIDPKINKPPDAPIFSYNVTVSLQQMVTLERNAAIKTISPTWALSRSGLAGERTLSAAVQRATADLVDRFVIDYKAVNK